MCDLQPGCRSLSCPGASVIFMCYAFYLLETWRTSQGHRLPSWILDLKFSHLGGKPWQLLCFCPSQSFYCRHSQAVWLIIWVLGPNSGPHDSFNCRAISITPTSQCLRHGLSLNQELTDVAGGQAGSSREPPVCISPGLGVFGSLDQFFRWGSLGIETQIFMLMQCALYTLRYLPSPLILFFELVVNV